MLKLLEAWKATWTACFYCKAAGPKSQHLALKGLKLLGHEHQACVRASESHLLTTTCKGVSEDTGGCKQREAETEMDDHKGRRGPVHGKPKMFHLLPQMSMRHRALYSNSLQWGFPRVLRCWPGVGTCEYPPFPTMLLPSTS